MLGSSVIVYAAETACNDNGGAGWAITDLGITNLLIPFNFGDVSEVFDLDVTTDITHTYIGDLTVKVTSPDSGTEVLLFERPGTAASDTAPTDTGPYGCNQDDLVATFNDEAGTGTTIENVCPVANGQSYLAEDALSVYDGEDPSGDWGFYLSDSANQDQGTLNEACITASFAAVTFDKWVSSNSSCNDNVDSIAVAPGTNVYFCYSVENPSTEPFVINTGDATDSQGHDLSPLEGITYTANGTAGDSQSISVGPIVAGSVALPVGTTVNNASVTGTFASADFTGTLTTPETATAVVGIPIIGTSTSTVIDINGGSLAPGDVIEYTVTINETAGIFTPNVQITDILDISLDTSTLIFTTIPAGTGGAPGFALAQLTGSTIDVTGINLPANGSVVFVFTIEVLAGTTQGTNINNTASISHSDSAVSYDAVSPTLIVLAADLSTSTKTVVDNDGGPLLPGDLITYTITLIETNGLAATDVKIVDVIDTDLTSITVTNNGGGVDTIAGNTLTITGLSVTASGSTTIAFTAIVNGTTPIGSSIDNTAIVTDNITGLITNVVAPTLVVGSSPANGNKRLYLDDLNTGTPILSRTVTTANTNSQDIDGSDSETFTINQSPTFQAPFTISAGTLSVQLNFESRGNRTNRRRDVEVDLIHVDGGTPVPLGTAAASYTNNGGTEYINFNFSLASSVNFSINDFLRINVRNVTNQANRRVRVRSLISGNLSQVIMSSTTVINLDSVGIFSAPYPAATQLKSYEPGTTVYLRTTVSDPFGNADINSVDFTASDPTPSQLFSTNVSSASATPTTSTAVFETPYTIPGPTINGFWTIGYTANEGTEGEVSHSATATMVVGVPILTVTKSSEVIFDPVNGGIANNPKALPNSIIEYTVEIENSGFGYVDINTIVVTDPIPSGSKLYIGSPVNPVDFTDGAIASGLAFSFSSLSSTTDDVDFSSNGGSTYITPSVDVNGDDNTSPDQIDFIRINPKGDFNGSDGTNHPSMTVKFRLRVN